jgi:hypothetical protein
MPCPRALASLILVLALAATSLIVPRTVASSTVASTQETARNAVAPLRGGSVLLAGDLRADVAVLRRAYETLHPGLYRYNTRAEMDEAFRALEAEFQRDRTLADTYLAFSVYAAKLRCGHSYANFYNQSKDVQDALFRAGRVPFHFRWLGHRMVVTRSFASEPRIRAGTEVLSINGVPVDAVLRRLMTVARADGGNDAKRRSDLEVQGANRWEAFDIFFPLLFPSPAPRMALRVLTAPGERVTALEVDPLTYEQRLATMATSRDPSGGEDAPAWDLRFLDVRTACLRMPNWALYDSKWDWKAFLEQSFDRVVGQKARDLVIDLRENEGGLGVGDDLLSHLIASDLPAEPVTRRVRYRSVPDDLVPYLDTWDRSFLDWGASAVEPSAGFFRLTKYDNDARGSVVKPRPPRFTGRVWVLVGAANSSATFEFAQAVQRNRLGTLVGQPTGGNQRGINGGAFFFLRLPRSGLELDLPLIGQFPDGERPDAGLEPDVLVVPTVSDIAGGRDAELEAVRARIAAGGG